MPELPEVETIKLGLQKKIVGLTIKSIEVRSPKSFIGSPQELQGKKITDVWRRAKVLGIDLAPSLRASAKQSSQQIAASSPVASPRNDEIVTLLFHLKMTGQLILVKSEKFPTSLKLRGASKMQSDRLIGGHPTPDMRDEMPNKHTRVIFEFSDGSKLYFNDQRRFGWAKLVQSAKLKVESSLKSLGPEPLEKDFTWEVLKNNLLKHKSMPVKVGIMDQSVVSGVGNIYANEACFDAGIDPGTKVSQLSDLQFKKLHKGIIKSLQDGIKHGGSTRAHFVDAEGRKGYFLDYAYVYGKNGQKCKKCGTVIKKINLGGRGTYFCDKCQK